MSGPSEDEFIQIVLQQVLKQMERFAPAATAYSTQTNKNRSPDQPEKSSHQFPDHGGFE